MYVIKRRTNGEEIIIEKGTIGILEEIANIDPSCLSSIKERMFMTLYMYGGFEEAMTLTDLCHIIYENTFMYGREKSSKYGNLYQKAQRLKTKGVLEELKNPLRYKLKTNKKTVNYLLYLLRERFGIVAREEIL